MSMMRHTDTEKQTIPESFSNFPLDGLKREKKVEFSKKSKRTKYQIFNNI